ncbi:MAG TPA: DUF1499 domain-containing protein, partial [Arenibaculum sp.]|nr:DUF1499 domain-containing protein [Arenibaculum sp.]
FAMVILGLRGGAITADSVLPLIATGVVLTLAALALAFYAILEIWYAGSIGTGDALMAVIYATPAASLTAAAIAAIFFYPPLNDLSTDLVRPPSFATLVAAESGGSLQPELQRTAYPDVVSRVYPVPLSMLYPATKELIEARGWDIVRDLPPPEIDTSTARLPRARPRLGDAPAAQPAAPFAEMEAIAPTPFLAIPDRVSVRLRSDEEGARIDLRSASAFGTHDLGANARRIRALYRDLDLLVQERSGGGEVLPGESGAEVAAEPATE